MDIIVDSIIYSREAVMSTVYHFSGDYSISVETSKEETNKYIISVEKEGKESFDTEFKSLFLKELTDQQVRLDIEKRFGHIRDLIVEEAFKPVTKH